MNSLSWMIYLASVAGSVSVICALAGIVFLIVAVVKTMNVFSDDFEQGNPTTKRAARTFFSRAAMFAIPLLLISALIPGKETVYAIAASEMGETALNSTTGSKAVRALNAWLDRQIDKENTHGE